MSDQSNALFPGERIIPINIEEEMKSAYIDYSMSVIVSRAIPDIRDGLKPVQRRVLYAMAELGLYHNRPYKKSARIVGEVLGKYHPHGDASIYDTLVRMAQPWVMRYPLVDGQGNFGSVDGDNAAAMRYTEARLSRIAEELLVDLDKDTVDFRPNFDDSLKEPTVLPARIPNLLLNGSSGIAVGMATTIAPHNLSEVVDGIIAYIDNRDITIDELMTHIKAPDFPTGGIIYGYEGVRRAFHEGKGRIVIRGRAEIEEARGGRTRIIVTELPYQVNKANMIMHTASLVQAKKIQGISDIRDESDRTGMRIVFELKREANPRVVLNKLYKFTQLQYSFNINNVALVNRRPQILNLKDLIRHYVAHRHEVLVRKTRYELAEAERRAHILEGLIIALDNLDAVIALIRNSRTPQQAKEGLMSNFGLSEIQAKAILDMRLHRLTGLEQEKLREDYRKLQERIAYLKRVLDEEDLRMDILKADLRDIKEKYGDARRSEIQHAAEEINIEDLIPRETVIVTISHLGYIKRTSLTSYRRQKRGGRGSRGASSREEDFIEHVFIADTHSDLLLFTRMGKVYRLKVYEIPDSGKASRGRAIQNLVSIEPGDAVRAYITVENFKEAIRSERYLIFATRRGVVKKTPLALFANIRSSGIRAIVINEGDELLQVAETDGAKHVVLASSDGYAVRFPEEEVRPMGRNAAGVRGIRLSGTDSHVVGMVIVTHPEEEDLLVISENGYGKRTLASEYRQTHRGARGVKTLQITPKTGPLVAILGVEEGDDIVIITRKGVVIRTQVTGKTIRRMGRATQGVRVIRLNKGDAIASVDKVAHEPEEVNENGEDNASQALFDKD